MNPLRITVLLFLALCGILSGQAQTLHATLTGFVFQYYPGWTATGSFDYNPTTSTVTNVAVTMTIPGQTPSMVFLGDAVDSNIYTATEPYIPTREINLVYGRASETCAHLLYCGVPYLSLEYTTLPTSPGTYAAGCFTPNSTQCGGSRAASSFQSSCNSPNANPCINASSDITSGSIIVTLGSKALGNGGTGQCRCGDPISIANGNVFEQFTDYETSGQNKLQFTRYYNSLGIGANTFASTLGANWRTNFDRYLQLTTATTVTAERADGQQINFAYNGTSWLPDTDVDMTLSSTGTTWTLTDGEDTVETYTTTSSGNEAVLNTIKARNGYVQNLTYDGAVLASVTDSYNRSFTMQYSGGSLDYVTTPDNTTIHYSVSSTGRVATLMQVGYPTSPTNTQYIIYSYGNTAFPVALTGITDENNNVYVTWTYDASGRASTNQLANNENQISVAYNDTDGSRTVTNGYGVVDTYSFSTLQGIPKVAQISRAATPNSSSASGTAAATKTFTYDGNGYLATETDWNGNKTTYTNNSHGLPTTVVEGTGSSVARTTTVAYDPTWVHLPATITTQGVTTTSTYDSVGEPLTQKLTDTTTTTVPYSTAGQTRTTTNTWSNALLASTKTPNGNITLFGYSSSGALTSITDPKTHITHISSYTGGGQPLTVVDPNGVTTTITYDGRQRLLTSTVATVGGNLLTRKYYDNNGAIGTYWPDGTSFTNVLDPGHRPLGFWDGTLATHLMPRNAVGAVYLSHIFDTGNNTTYQRSFWTDALGRTTFDTSQQTGQSWTYSYDPNGNPLTVTDPLSNTTTRLFDALNRLYKSTDSNTGITQTTFDAHDRALTVSDPLSNVTTYVYDGFGDKIEEVSPDKGTTVFHYDGDANLTSKTDAASVVTTWTYDALDRPLTVSYPADAAENVAFTYDQTGGIYANGVGRLTSFTDAAGSVTRLYDQQGNLLNEKRTIGTTIYTTSYTYNSANRVATITYPSGTLVTYTRDSGGRVSNIATKAPGQSSVNLASSITYQQMGPVTGVTSFNGDTEAFAYDLDYRMTSLITTATNGSQHQAYTYDYADNLTGITDTVCTTCSATYAYDVLNRLKTASSWYGSYAYTMDKNGNMLTNNEQGYGGTYSYTAGTNRISSILVSGTSYPVSYTATGNITAFTRIPGQATALTYNKANELASSTGAGTAATYGYNAFRQRVSKTDSGTTATLYFYDQDGNTIEELDGGAYHDYFTLNNRVIGALTPSTNTLAFLHGDRLGSPQLATDANAKIAQSFSYTPYGSISTTTQQAGAATLTQNNRFPGQLFDPETLLNHNGFREYSSTLGRYSEADPIGLRGGANPYRYANGNPMSFVDRYGLDGSDFMGTAYTVGAGITISKESPEEKARDIAIMNEEAKSVSEFTGEMEEVSTDAAAASLVIPGAQGFAPIFGGIAFCSGVVHQVFSEPEPVGPAVSLAADELAVGLKQEPVWNIMKVIGGPLVRGFVPDAK